jgi:hypothetical protein
MAEVSQAELARLQTQAMRAMVESMRSSLSNYIEAVEQSPELRKRLASDPVLELVGVADLVVRRALAIVESAEALNGPAPETVPGPGHCWRCGAPDASPDVHCPACRDKVQPS